MDYSKHPEPAPRSATNISDVREMANPMLGDVAPRGSLIDRSVITIRPSFSQMPVSPSSLSITHRTRRIRAKINWTTFLLSLSAP